MRRFLLATTVVFILGAPHARAQYDEQRLDVMLARVFVSERGLHPTDDDYAIWQVVQNVRSRRCDNTRLVHLPPSKQISQCRVRGAVVDVAVAGMVEHGRETHLSALRRLSRITTGRAKSRTFRQAWTTGLSADGSQPKGWVSCRDAHPCHGEWARYRGLWLRTVQRAQEVIRAPRRVCAQSPGHGPVLAWGTAQDMWLAQQRRLVEITCGSTRNRFFAKPRTPELLR